MSCPYVIINHHRRRPYHFPGQAKRILYPRGSGPFRACPLLHRTRAEVPPPISFPILRIMRPMAWGSSSSPSKPEKSSAIDSMRASSDFAMRTFVMRRRTFLLLQCVQVTGFFPYSAKVWNTSKRCLQSLQIKS